MNQLEALENLIIATLLQEPLVTESPNGHIKNIQIPLEIGKEDFLNRYIARYKLENDVTILQDKDSHTLYLKSSLVIERIVRDWMTRGEVTGLNPSKVSSELFMLWICLYGRKTEKNVVIDTSLDEQVKQTISKFFHKYLHTNLIDKGIAFQIMPFTNILLKSYQEKRALEETKELNKLLTDKERNKLKTILIKWEEYHEFV